MQIVIVFYKKIFHSKIFLSPSSPDGWAVAAAVCCHKRACYSPCGAGVVRGRFVPIRDSTVQRVGRLSARLGLFYDLGREAAHGASRLRSRLFRSVLRIELFSTQHCHGSVSLTEWPLCGEPPIEEVGDLYALMCILVLTEHQLLTPSVKIGIVLG